MKRLFVLMAFLATLGISVPAGANQWSYAGDPGFVARNPGEMAAAKRSWETPEYGFYTGNNPALGTSVNAQWGLHAINASTAYALGFYGQGATIGFMDSGTRATHQEYQTDMIKYVTAAGFYGTSGFGYRSATPGNPFTKGDWFTVAGDQAKTTDYGHGTGMLGVSAAMRDGRSGANMHGGSFGSIFYVAKTGGSDSQSHGPFHDYNYMYTAYKALVDAGSQVINSSWGSYVQTLNRNTTNGMGIVGDPGSGGMYELTGRDSGNMATVLPNDTLADLEYQHFMFKKAYGVGGPQYDPNSAGLSFLDAQYNAVKNTRGVMVWSAGNNDWRNPYYRPSYPLFNPRAEQHWIATGGVLRPTTDGAPYALYTGFNEAGLAKWWFVASPAQNIYDPSSSGDANYAAGSGTSPAAPHTTMAMGVLLSRYPNMDAIQVRDVLFTTATTRNADGTKLALWTAAEGLPDTRWGWGIPDLDKGMYGPGQFLSPFTYNMSRVPLDVWTNNISQVAIKEREREDLAWLADYKANGIGAGFGPNVKNPDGTLNPQAFMTQGILNDPAIIALTNGNPADYDKISYEDAVKWRKQWMDEKAAFIQEKIDKGLYTASLVKQGPGTLVMTGDNTYQGGTTVEGGALYGFTESFGSGTVNVNGGSFGVLAGYNDLFTMKGQLNSTQSRLANITVNNGGTYNLMADNSVNVGSLTFNKGSKLMVTAVDTNQLRTLFANPNSTATGSVTASALTGFENMALQDYALFSTNLNVTPSTARSTGATIKGTLQRNNATLASYANSGSARSVANVISSNISSPLMDNLLWATRDQAADTVNTLGNETYLNADNSSIVNSLMLSRMIKNQALGSTPSKTVAISDKARMWATGIGNWSTNSFGSSDLDGEFYAGMIGVEANITPNNKIGLFFGAGVSEFRGGRWGKIESDDLHGGIYGTSNIADVMKLAYGVMHTRQDRSARRTMVAVDQSRRNNVDNDTNITQFFAELAYTQFNNDKFSLEPYLGINVMRLKSGSFNESVSNYRLHTDSNKQTLEAASLGLRGSVPIFTRDTMNIALRGDLSGTAFMGDTTPEATLSISDVGKAKIKGGKMNDPLLNTGLGFDAAFGKTVNVSLSYEGSFNSDITSNGIMANFRINF